MMSPLLDEITLMAMRNGAQNVAVSRVIVETVQRRKSSSFTEASVFSSRYLMMTGA
jgi:hypothetical protein